LFVAGHSFTGSSGSPVLTHGNGTSSQYVPARMIGIMSGHFQERVDAPRNVPPFRDFRI
jgi:hypothetical protein